MFVPLSWTVSKTPHGFKLFCHISKSLYLFRWDLAVNFSHIVWLIGSNGVRTAGDVQIKATGTHMTHCSSSPEPGSLKIMSSVAGGRGPGGSPKSQEDNGSEGIVVWPSPVGGGDLPLSLSLR